MSDGSDGTETDGATKKKRDKKQPAEAVFFHARPEGDFDETSGVDPPPPGRRGDAIVFPSKRGTASRRWSARARGGGPWCSSCGRGGSRAKTGQE